MKKTLQTLCAAVLCGLAVLPVVARASWDPPGWKKDPAPEESRSTSPAALSALWGLAFYRTFISPVDGERCPSYPSCSTYAVEAVGRHGFLLGILLTGGRLVAEADEAAFSPRILVNGRWRVYSPVEDDLAFLRGRLAP